MNSYRADITGFRSNNSDKRNAYTAFKRARAPATNASICPGHVSGSLPPRICRLRKNAGSPAGPQGTGRSDPSLVKSAFRHSAICRIPIYANHLDSKHYFLLR